MRGPKTRKADLPGGALVLALALALTPTLNARGAVHARLPVRHYTSADGLAQDQVLRMTLDAEGFLWIVSAGGLSRFDGERFTVFGEADGLRGRLFNDIAVGRDQTYWVATDAGLFAFRPGEVSSGHPLFREVALDGLPENDEPYRLLASRSGALWVGTRSQLWRVESDGERDAAMRVELHPGRPPRERFRDRVQCLAEDPSGAIWIGTHTAGIYRIGPDGSVDHCPDPVPGASFVRDFQFPGDGSVWTAYLGGLAIFDRPPFQGMRSRPAPRLFGTREGVPMDTSRLLPLDEQHVLLGTSSGINEIHRTDDGVWRIGPTLDRRSGLPGDFVSSLVRDAQGNLWVGLSTHGLVKIPPSGFSILVDAEEPGAAHVDLTTDRRGRLVTLASKGAKALTAYCPDADPPGPFNVSLPSSLNYVGWGGSQKFLVDRRGSWWIATGAGILRYDDPGLEGPRRLRRPPDAILGTREGLPGKDVFIVKEDARGDVWISVSTQLPEASSIARWSRASGRIEAFSARAVGSRALAARFVETRDGSLWITLIDGALLRYREGRFQPIRVSPENDLDDWIQDSRGRLWAYGQGAYVCDDPSAAEPLFAPREVVPGEPDAHLECAVEDRDGRLWFGTPHGVLRLDPDSGERRRFTIDDGLAGNSIQLCERDGKGVLWFSDQNGLSRYEARPEPRVELARARIREIRIAGEAVPLPPNGTTSTAELTIPADRRRLAVEFFAIHHGLGPRPRFEYRLEGADTDWSAPASERSVQYAHLAPGRYRFEVRTVGEDGTSRGAPAFAPILVLAPLWQRPWFAALCLVAAAGLAYAAYRVRLARVIALERLRTRIATDLHDDIGASLSQISILSQIAHRQAGGAAPQSLERITTLSGELIDAMSDVVWAISPRWDTVSALVHRMRRFASELFADGDGALELRLPQDDDAPVDPDVRRTLYLVFKEALHNVRRHASRSEERRVG